MGLRVQIESALAAAQDENDHVGVGALRLAQCAVRDRDRVNKGAGAEAGCEDRQIAEIINQMIAQRVASAADYERSGRLELAERELQELAVLRGLLPEPLNDSQVRAIAEDVVDDLKARGLKDLGRCVAEVKRRAGGVDANAPQVSAVIKQMLNTRAESR